MDPLDYSGIPSMAYLLKIKPVIDFHFVFNTVSISAAIKLIDKCF